MASPPASPAGPCAVEEFRNNCAVKEYNFVVEHKPGKFCMPMPTACPDSSPPPPPPSANETPPIVPTMTPMLPPTPPSQPPSPRGRD